ncbi:MAG TPA: M3 family oligoendopeptidase, partial [Ruminococcaceae bacterium]|nr:M3 family oligoendopeptidase [Oscillospiraceae bacterium]
MKFSQMKYERPDLEAVKAELTKLTEELKSAENYDGARKAFVEFDAVKRKVETQGTLASVRHSIDTRDEFYEAEKKFWNAASPELDEYFQNWTMALLESKFRTQFEEEFGNIVFINAEIDLKAFSPEIIPELQKENDLVQEYQKL